MFEKRLNLLVMYIVKIKPYYERNYMYLAGIAKDKTKYWVSEYFKLARIYSTEKGARAAAKFLNTWYISLNIEVSIKIDQI